VRGLLGALAGILVMLIYTLFFHQPGNFTPTLSLVIAILVSKLSTPKHLAGLGALIGSVAGLTNGVVFGLQFVTQNVGRFNIVIAIIGAYFIVSFMMIFLTGVYAFLGFFFAQLMKLYKRRAIF
jgi:hypothetical protein